MNIEGITLKLLLSEESREKALNIYSQLNISYFTSSFKTVYKVLSQFYNENGYIPTAQELKVYRHRDSKVLNSINSLMLVDTLGINIELAVDELLNAFTQTKALEEISKLLDSMPIMDREDLINHLSMIPQALQEQIAITSCVHTAKSIPLFKTPETFKLSKVLSGVCDAWDYEAGGFFMQDLVLFGGKRGSGKSILCANIIAQQHKQGNVSIYFTIEMRAEEVFHRICCILAGVSPLKLKNNTLTDDEISKLAKTMASLFVGGDEVYKQHFIDNPNPNPLDFQADLALCEEKEEGRIIIVDDPSLSLPTIDTQLSMVKSKYGDKFKACVVDYVNQVVVPGIDDRYDWKAQILVSTALKNYARKNNVFVAAPYQIDDNGIARFSKGILDAPDVAMLLKVDDKADNSIMFEVTKARSASDTGRYRVGIDWETLIIDPREVVLQDMQHETDSPSEEAAEQDLNRWNK